MLELFLFCVGLVLLVSGAELLVGGASRLAAAFGISPLVIGLTVVAFGTSSPELAVSLRASLSGSPDLAMGNVVGSNICNVLLILGLAALVVPLAVDTRLVRLEVPLMIGVSALLWLLALDRSLDRWDGLLLCACGLAYVAFTVHRSRKQRAVPRSDTSAPRQGPGDVGGPALAETAADADEPVAGRRVAIELVRMLAGLVMLVLGSHWMVAGAVTLARLIGMSELVIGLTVVAAGTSLPEIATSVMASLRGERDIAVGNAVGSNLFNILLVLGLSAVLAPDGIAVSAAALVLDIPVMTFVALACLPIFFTGYCIARWEGALFLGYYVAYTAYLVLAAREHAVLGTYSVAMLWFAIPLTAVTLLVLSVHGTIRGSQP